MIGKICTGHELLVSVEKERKILEMCAFHSVGLWGASGMPCYIHH
jgi:hypothetical protein